MRAGARFNSKNVMNPLPGLAKVKAFLATRIVIVRLGSRAGEALLSETQ